MLRVWCVCVGDKYSDDYVYRLKAMVERNLEQPFEFTCLTDRAIPGVDCYLTPVNWPGWWQKLYLFKAATPGEKNLYLDLDVVVTGPLDDLVSDQLSMPSNWAQSGHGGCQSSVMAWSKNYERITASFDPDLLSDGVSGNYGYYGPKRLWGDQEFITDLMGDPVEVTSFGSPAPEYLTSLGVVTEMQGIKSYKYHCRNALPHDAKVVCFHGNPKPADVKDQWVINARSYTHEPINSLAS